MNSSGRTISHALQNRRRQHDADTRLVDCRKRSACDPVLDCRRLVVLGLAVGGGMMRAPHCARLAARMLQAAAWLDSSRIGVVLGGASVFVAPLGLLVMLEAFAGVLK